MTAEPDDVGVLVVDDHATFRSVAREVIARTPGFAVVGEAVDGAAAIDAVRELEPRLVLMDIHLPGVDGLAATRVIAEERPDVVVVLLSTYDRDDLPVDPVTTGACTYLHKAELAPATVRALWERYSLRST